MTTLPVSLAAVAATLTATVGFVVAAYAYRGYRNHGSDRMRPLAAGILCIAVLPPLVTYPLQWVVALTDAQSLVLVLTAHTLGLLAIYRSLD